MYPNQLFNPNQKIEVPQVSGENGARLFQMPPNSSVLLLDNSAPIIWLVQTDGAGYKTLSPYDISPHIPEPPVDIKSLEHRLNNLENMLKEALNAKSDVITVDETKPAVWQPSENKTNDNYF